MSKNIRERAIEELRGLFDVYADAAAMYGMYDEILEQDPNDENAQERIKYYLEQCYIIQARINSIKRVYGLL